MYNIIYIHKGSVTKQTISNGIFYNNTSYNYEYSSSLHIDKFNFIPMKFSIKNLSLSTKQIVYFNLLGYKLDIDNGCLQINGDIFFKFVWDNCNRNKRCLNDIQFLISLLKDNITLKNPITILLKDEKTMNDFYITLKNYVNKLI